MWKKWIRRRDYAQKSIDIYCSMLEKAVTSFIKEHENILSAEKIDSIYETLYPLTHVSEEVKENI